jgi:hypothetical protein
MSGVARLSVNICERLRLQCGTKLWKVGSE